MGTTLGMYISFRYLKVLLAMVLGLAFLIITVDFVEQIRRTAEIDDVSIGDLYQISLMRAPIFVERIFPFASLFAAMITLTQLNNKMELVVARAAGVSAWQFLLPITLSAAIVGAVVATVYNPLAIMAFKQSNELAAEVLSGGGVISDHIKGNHWIKQEDADGGRTLLNAQIVRRDGKLLDQVKVVRFNSDGALVQRLDSLNALYRNDHWLLVDVLKTDDRGRSERVDVYRLPTRLSENALLGIGTTPDHVPFWQLLKVAKQVENSGTNPLPYLVQYHSLTALPLFLVAMTLVAATVCLRFVRFGQVAKMILGGILFGFVLYTATTLVVSLGNNGVVPPAVAAWAPGIVAILFGMSTLLHQEDG